MKRILVFALLVIMVQSAFGQKKKRQKNVRRTPGAGITDRVHLFDLGLSLTTYYTSSTVDGLRETLIREEFFTPGTFNVETSSRNGGGLAISVPVQWQKNLYSQGGIMYEWQNINSSSDLKFTNLEDDDKSFDLWLNYKYFGFSAETGVSLPLPFKWNKAKEGLMFTGLTYNMGIGMKYSTPVGQEFVRYEASPEPSSEDLKVQEDLRGLLSPPSSKLNLYWINRIGYEFVFIEFILESSDRDALKAVEENIYNFKENDNRRTNLFFGLGFRYSFHNNRKQG